MRKIKLTNGTELQVSLCGADNGMLWIHVTEPGYTIAKAVKAFTPKTTKIIVYVYGEMQEVYDGYTDLKAVTMGAEDVTVGLRMPMV